jgi:hypothetical protein
MRGQLLPIFRLNAILVIQIPPCRRKSFARDRDDAQLVLQKISLSAAAGQQYIGR